MSKKHNKRNKHKKGPQMSEGERLWKRMSAIISGNDELWTKTWDAQSIAEILIQEENLNNRFSVDDKAEKIFRSKLDQSLAEIRKQNQYFVNCEMRKLRLRTPSEIDDIKSNIAQWRVFLDNHCSSSELFQGPPKLKDDDDKNRYTIIENVWLSLLLNSKLPSELTLKSDENITSWGKFNLVKEVAKFADQRSGFRFQESKPSMALLLLQNGRVSVTELLDMRLEARQKDGRNPFPREYDEQLSKHSENQPEVNAENMIAEGRTDLRNLPFVTIDPHDAKDFDDAVCLIEENGKTTLWVAIADVAHYVKVGTRLDNSARARATSVYLPHAVLPMLPPKLADDLCSLRAEVDRLAMVVAMELDSSGEIVNSNAYEAVIRVTENLSYEDAIGDERFDSMFKLAAKWQAGEVRLNIHNAEMRPRILDNEQIKVEVKWPTDATQMIESFMVATNATVGHMLGKQGAPLPWRCHASPDSAEVKELNAKLKVLNVDIELPMPSFKTHGQTDSDELTNLLGAWAQTTIETITIENQTDESTDDVPEYLQGVLDPDARQEILDSLLKAQEKASKLDGKTRRVVDQGLFQLMQRANYSADNLGHFGLNLDAYVHFTSPIRRYPDLMTHRQLKAHLREEDWVHDMEETAEIAEHCSSQGMIAKYIEWELVANAYHIHLIRGGEIDSVSENSFPEMIEKSWPARIVGLRTPWVFLDLNDDGAIQGRMHLRQMGQKQRLNIDENGLEVSTAEPGPDGQFKIIAKLGDKYPCRLRGIDIWGGSLDLSPK